MWRIPACKTLWKALDISSATAWVPPDLLKALATVKRYAVDREDLKPYWKFYISLGDQQPSYLQIFQTLASSSF